MICFQDICTETDAEDLEEVIPLLQKQKEYLETSQRYEQVQLCIVWLSCIKMVYIKSIVIIWCCYLNIIHYWINNLMYAIRYIVLLSIHSCCMPRNNLSCKGCPSVCCLSYIIFGNIYGFSCNNYTPLWRFWVLFYPCVSVCLCVHCLSNFLSKISQ